MVNGELQICNSTMKLRKLPVVWVVRVTPRFWGLLVIPKFGVSVATITTFVTVDAFTPLGKGITIIITPTEQVKPTSLINV